MPKNDNKRKSLANQKKNTLKQTSSKLNLNLFKKIQPFFSKKSNIINSIGGIIAILGFLFSITIYIDNQINKFTLSKIEPFQELITALTLHQNNYNYNAAERLARLYDKFKKLANKDILPSVVTSLLESISSSGYQEEFLNTVEQIQKDNLVSLQRRHLNDIGLIYLSIGQLEKSENILKIAASFTEAPSAQIRGIEAITHWYLTLLYITKSNTNLAATNFVKATKKDPANFKIKDLRFNSIDEVAVWNIDSDLLERLRRINLHFNEDFFEFSKVLNLH